MIGELIVGGFIFGSCGVVALAFKSLCPPQGTHD